MTVDVPTAERARVPGAPVVLADLLAFMHDYLGLQGVGASTRLGQDVPFDSFAVVDVIAFVEAKYGVKLDVGRLSITDFATPSTIANRVARGG